MIATCEILKSADVQPIERLEEKGVAGRLHLFEHVRRYAVELVYAERVGAILREMKENGRRPMAEMRHQLSSPSPAFEAVCLHESRPHHHVAVVARGQ